MNAQVTIETINPKTAAEWLENKWEEQRPIREGHTNRLAADMKMGRFRLASDAIMLIKGRLANGQHRLSAVVMSGKSCQFIVMRTNDEELYKLIDCGAWRRVSDVIGKVQYAKTVSAAARLSMVYDMKLVSGSGTNETRSKNQLTRIMIVDYIDKHRSALEEQASFVSNLWAKSRVIGCTTTTALLHIASRNNPDKAHEFIRNVYTGDCIDASKDFRDRMIKHLGSKSQLRQEYIFALLVKCWNSFLNGTRPGSLKMNDGESFPEIK